MRRRVTRRLIRLQAVRTRGYGHDRQGRGYRSSCIGKTPLCQSLKDRDAKTNSGLIYKFVSSVTKNRSDLDCVSKMDSVRILKCGQPIIRPVIDIGMSVVCFN